MITLAIWDNLISYAPLQDARLQFIASIVEEYRMDVIKEIDLVRQQLSDLEEVFAEETDRSDILSESWRRLDIIRNHLLAEDNQFWQLAENLGEVLWVVSPDYQRNFYVSPAFKKVWGRSCASLYQAPFSWAMAIHPEDRARVHQALEHRALDGNFNEEYRIVRPDGTIRWIDDRAFPVRAVDGSLARIVGIAVDVTTHKQQAEALSHSRDDLEKLVAHRTSDLLAANQQLQQEIAERLQASKTLSDKEQQLDDLLSNVDAIILEGNPHNVYYAGGQLEKILGYPKADWFDHSDGPVGFWSDHLHPEDSGVIEKHKHAIDRREDHTLEFRMIHRDGRTIWFHESVTMEAKEGKPIRLRCIMFDITSRKEADLALRETKASLLATMAASRDPLITINYQGIIHSVSNSVAEVFGWQPDEMLGKNVRMLMPEPIRSEHDDYLGQYDQTGDTTVLERTREVEALRKDGSVFPCEIAFSRVDVPGQAKPLFLAVIRDTTERKAAERHSKNQYDQLAHVARVSTMREMATGIVHELNQPLTAIGNYAFAGEESLAQEGGPTPDHLRDIFQGMPDQAVRAGNIIRRLRSLVKSEGSHATPTDLNRVIQESMALIQTDLHLRQIHADVNLDEDLGHIAMDPIQIQQVMVNLIRNAIEAMGEANGKPHTLMISTSKNQTQGAEIAVSDSGMGIDPEHGNEYLFDAFYSTKPSGMGMGLAISRSIVEDHNGRLWVEPNADRGVTFRFTLQSEAAENVTK